MKLFQIDNKYTYSGVGGYGLHCCFPTHHFLYVPVKHIVIVVAQLVEEVSEELSQVGIVWPVRKLERLTEGEVRGKLTYIHGVHAMLMKKAAHVLYMFTFQEVHNSTHMC